MFLFSLLENLVPAQWMQQAWKLKHCHLVSHSNILWGLHQPPCSPQGSWVKLCRSPVTIGAAIAEAVSKLRNAEIRSERIQENWLLFNLLPARCELDWLQMIHWTWRVIRYLGQKVWNCCTRWEVFPLESEFCLLLCLSCRIEIWWEVGAGLNNGKKWNNHSKHDFVYLFNIIILVTHPISKHSTLMNKVPVNSKNMID